MIWRLKVQFQAGVGLLFTRWTAGNMLTLQLFRSPRSPLHYDRMLNSPWGDKISMTFLSGDINSNQPHPQPMSSFQLKTNSKQSSHFSTPIHQDEIHALVYFCFGNSRYCNANNPKHRSPRSLHRISPPYIDLPRRPSNIHPRHEGRWQLLQHQYETHPSNFASKTNNHIDNELGVSLIETATYNIWLNCNFYTTGQKAIATTGSGTTVDIGPPQPILSVACRPTPNPPGNCLPDFAMCEWCGGGFGGCLLQGCCTGFCAATRCRPFPPTQT